MFEIRPAEPADAEAVVAMLVEAFAADPLISYFFPGGRQAGASSFFSILLRVRLALEMPVLVLSDGGKPLGVAMGYDASRPTWPASYTAEWRALEASVAGLVDRLAAYDAISDAHLPSESHYYLGVLGVHPSAQGRGAGKALLSAFCERSRADGRSGGVYLETGSAASLAFYSTNGFEVRGDGALSGAHVWCVYRRT